MIGAEDFYRYQSIFGFGAQTGIDLPGEAEGILQDQSW
ncbi:MAG: penicillin-binding transpeptidase domain-containing protein [Coprococcus sp.]